MAESRREFFVRIGRLGGLRGGKARRRWETPLKVESARMAAWCLGQMLTPEQRRERARKAALARWERHEKAQAPQAQPVPMKPEVEPQPESPAQEEPNFPPGFDTSWEAEFQRLRAYRSARDEPQEGCGIFEAPW